VITSAAPFIPAELEMTLDGISGIIMGNAFTIPQNRLPLSLRGKDGLAKVAFIVTGLTHTIQNNEWLTKIKGQMIKLREQVKQITASTLVGQIQEQQNNLARSSNTARGTDLFTNSNASKTSSYLFGSAKNISGVINPAHPNWGDLPEIWQNNNAWDLGVAAGTPVYAIADGTVSDVKFSENKNTVWGYKLTLTSSNNTFFYTHLDSVVVSGGTKVKKGDLVAYVGQWPSDYAVRLQNYPHLHIGLKTGTLLTYIDNTGKLL
jgi:murein DD-endopeptidase MepM/ murein hydrolase activator NlpD